MKQTVIGRGVGKKSNGCKKYSITATRQKNSHLNVDSRTERKIGRNYCPIFALATLPLSLSESTTETVTITAIRPVIYGSLVGGIRGKLTDFDRICSVAQLCTVLQWFEFWSNI